MLFLIGANIICILVQFFFGDCRSFKLRKVERPNKKTANVQMPRTVEKSCGPVNPIHSVVSDAFFFLDRPHSISCEICQHSTNFKEQKAKSNKITYWFSNRACAFLSK